MCRGPGLLWWAPLDAGSHPDRGFNYGRVCEGQRGEVGKGGGRRRGRGPQLLGPPGQERWRFLCLDLFVTEHSESLCFSAGPWKILLPFYWPISSSRDTVGIVVRDTPGFVSVPKSHAPHGFRPWAPQLFSPAPSHRICEEIGGGLLRLALPPSSSVAWDPHLLPPGCVLLFLSPCPVLGAVARA